MANNRYPLLAHEGWVHIALAASAALLVHLLAGWAWALPLWLVALFVVQFFRDPPRAIPTDAGVVVAPADGRVIAVANVQDPYLQRPALKVSIFMNVFNVHSNRCPIAGNVMERWYHAGSFVNAALDKASEHNERNALWLRGDAGEDVVCVQVAGLIARRILCYAGPGDRLERVQRYGFIRFGSRLDLFLPADAVIKTSVGAKVSAGSDIVAVLLH